VLGPLYILSASTTWRSAYIFFTSSIAFLNAIARYITIGKGTSDSIIWGYALNTNSIGIRPLGPTELLITLKVIYSTISLLIPGILEVII
jgi:hypothetical protein